MDASKVNKVIRAVADEIIAAKTELTDIDSKLGDGDMGLSMEKGALALKAVLKDDAPDIAAMLGEGAAAFNRAAPSTMGTLLSFALQETAKFWKEKQNPKTEDLVHIPRLMADVIAKRGRAKEGDKTILDALLPFAAALEETFAATGSLKEALGKAADAAREGMEKTKGMIAKTGRAKWLGERNKECPDGGAVLCAKIAARLETTV